MLTKEEILAMSDEELKMLAREKQKSGKRKGCATRNALTAQTILHERAGRPYQGSVINNPMGSKRFHYSFGMGDQNG